MHPRNLNYVLGSIGQGLNEISAKWNQAVPPIQSLVVNKATQLPGEGFDEFLLSKAQFRRLSMRERRLHIDEILRQVFTFPRWQEVLAYYQIAPIKMDYSAILRSAAAFRAGGEGEAHRRLKEYVSKTPSVLGLPPTWIGLTEHPLPSGDRLDVLFNQGIDWVAAEVKPRGSTEEDIVRGLFQCLKYRVVVEAYQAVLGKNQGARVVLVLEGGFPPRLTAMKNMLGIEVMPAVRVPDDFR